MHSDPREDFRRRERPARTSQVLCDFIASLDTGRVSLEDIIAALGDRGLGVLIALFAVPNILPSTVPFGNVATGVPVILLAIHLMLGWPRLVLPGFLAKRTVSAKSLKTFAPRVISVLSRIERLLKPRLLGVSSPAAERIIGVLCLFLSIISALPIPFGHMVPALALTIIGLGLIEHDGFAILLGAGIGVAGVMLLGLILFGLATGLAHFPFWVPRG
jgi:hypothetical protein